MLDLSLDHNILIYDTITAAVQELDILFNTENTELINNPLFGTNFEQFLWQMTPATSSLKKYICEKIGETLFLSQLEYNVNVELLKGELRLIYDVSIEIKDKNGKKITRKYQFR